VSKADLDKQPAQVAAMFDEVSTHYDRTNTVLSVGNASLWRVATTRAVGPRAGERILDVAAGTGTSSASLARNGASVVAADFSEGMIEVGRRRQADNPYVTFVQADATQLPFDDASFNAVTISFGLRNIVDPRKALAEFYRVTKPGGRVVICEFSHPPAALIRGGYSMYLRYGMPLLARAASSNPAAYEYLMDSIQAWPEQPELASWLRSAGYEDVAWRNLTAGIVALHRGRKPGAGEMHAIRGDADVMHASAGRVSSRVASANATTGDAKSAPTQPAPAKAVRVKSSPENTARAKAASAKVATADSEPAKTVPAKSGPAKAKTVPAKPAPAPAKSGPAKAESAKSSPAKKATTKSSSTKPAASKKPAVSKSTPAESDPASPIPAPAKSTPRKPAGPAKASTRGGRSEDSSSVVPNEGE
jgi:demethylmenaquinone methyltransferase / 2-methoxy-6-polyprenyl-1,4-benzoquinol methylase